MLIYNTDEGPLMFYQSLEEISVDLQIQMFNSSHLTMVSVLLFLGPKKKSDNDTRSVGPKNISKLYLDHYCLRYLFAFYGECFLSKLKYFDS